MTFWQCIIFFHQRAVIYGLIGAAPIRAFYLGGSRTQRGGVMGLSGFNAAREVLSDWRGRKLA
jgi:phytoene dehydrogenase-like protein